ncbi:transcription initiation factor TFIID subunit 5 [Histomonas meleagridis]|uniref:transcription initiation factor TFIID subunit 5 n=1 Tax=Histomonas meleagridis TaxID=135588 RepID=UPI003559ACED|nr:transcription initiation factor TFIID subunit 5 [Histomonas meleagridis]KAH0799709.1 transcription initiation factor TFIID subunit 5 [Histomonas meleagridis]
MIIIEYKKNGKEHECDEFIQDCLHLIPDDNKDEINKFLNDEAYYKELSSLFETHHYIIPATEDEADMLNQYLHQPLNSKLLNIITETVILIPIYEEVPSHPIHPKFNLETPFSSMNIVKSRIPSARFVFSPPNYSSVFSCLIDSSIVQIHTDTEKVTKLYYHSSEVTTMSISNKNTILLTSDIIGTIKLWSSNALVTVPPIHSPSWCSSFAPQGGIFCIGSDDGIVRLYDTPHQKLRRVLVGHSEPVLAVGFHPNCSLVASTSRDLTTRIWDLREAESVRLFICENKVNNYVLALSSDGQYLAVWDQKLYVNDIGSGKTLFSVQTYTNHIVNMKFSMDSRYIYMMSLDGRLLCCNVIGDSHAIFQIFDVGEKTIACEFLKSNEVHVFTSSDF